jgi:hypothetical protein
MMSRLTRRGDVFWLVALTILAWIHRIAFLLSNRDRAWPFTVFYEGDSESFYLFARSVLEGVPYDGGIPFHPPAFPYFLAFVHTLLGAGTGTAQVPHLAVKIVMGLVGSLPVGLVYLISRPYIGKTPALVTSVLCLYSFGLYVIAVAPVTEGLYLTLLLTTLLLWSRALPHPLSAVSTQRSGDQARKAEHATSGSPPTAGQAFAGLWLGVLVGVLSLTRTEGLLIGLVLWATGAIGLVTRRRRKDLRWRFVAPWLLAVAGFILVLTPWTLRNASTLSDINRRTPAQLEPLPTFVPLTAYGPLNFALANNEKARGTFSREILPRGDREAVLDLLNPEHRRLFLDGYSVGLDYIRRHPGDFARLVIRKWGIFFDAWKLGWTQWNLPGGLDGLRRPVDLFVPHSYAALLLQVPLAVLGMVLLFSAPGGPRRWAWIVLLVTLSGMLTTGSFFGYVRQGAVLLPLWLSLVATGAVWMVSRVVSLGRPAGPMGEPSTRMLRIFGLIALALLVVEAWGATTNRDYRATGTTRSGEQFLNRDDVIYLEPLRDTEGGSP